MSTTELHSSVFYVGTPSMPARMTVNEYRRSRPRRRSHWRRLRSLTRPQLAAFPRG